MKAIRVQEFGGPEVLRLEDVPDPHPGAGQVLVRVRAVGVNPVDTYIRAGAHAVRPQLPYTPGLDAAGTVEAVGEGVTRVSAGDRVYTSGSLSGTYAELALCDESQVHTLPARVSFAEGAGVSTPYATAYRALFQRARATPGETVLVHGASGGVGTAAVQIARAAGFKVIGTGGTEEGRSKQCELGLILLFIITILIIFIPININNLFQKSIAPSNICGLLQHIQPSTFFITEKSLKLIIILLLSEPCIPHIPFLSQLS